MELTSQYTSTSVGTLPQDTRAHALQSALAQRGQPRMFAESDTPLQFAAGRDDQRHYAAKGDTQSREKRGGVLGACAKSEFRECRGGNALKDGSTSYVNFDQFDRKKTRGDGGRGTCEGIVREAMRRIDRSYAGTGETAGPSTPDLPSAVTSMIRDMRDARSADNSNIYDNIDRYQNNPGALALLHYQGSTAKDFTRGGDLSVKSRINGLMNSVSSMPQGGLALIHVGVQRPNAPGSPSAGHAIIVQRFPTTLGGDAGASPDRYAIFDPNNGAFTYDSEGAMHTALRNYLETAFAEDGNVVAPDNALFFTPRSTSAPLTEAPTSDPTVVPPPAHNLPEPFELALHMHGDDPVSEGGPWPHTDL